MELEFDDQPGILVRLPFNPKKIYVDRTYEGLVSHAGRQHLSIGMSCH